MLNLKMIETSIYLYHTSSLMHRDESSVMFPLGSVGVGSCNIRPPRPNKPVGIDLTPTPIPAAKLRIFHPKQMTTEIALYLILQQPISTWKSLTEHRKKTRGTNDQGRIEIIQTTALLRSARTSSSGNLGRLAYHTDFSENHQLYLCQVLSGGRQR